MLRRCHHAEAPAQGGKAGRSNTSFDFKASLAVHLLRDAFAEPPNFVQRTMEILYLPPSRSRSVAQSHAIMLPQLNQLPRISASVFKGLLVSVSEP